MLYELEKNSYFVREDFLNTKQVDLLYADLEARFAEGEFRPAGVGQRAVPHAEIRRDHIFWLEKDQPEFLWALLSNLQNELNHKFYLGLDRFEGHYARYPAGGFYKRHRDNLSKKDTRIISLILYLNKGWQPENGGELELELETGSTKIAPKAGTLVCFLSRELEHQVLPCTQPRLSFCGWFHCVPGPSPL